MNLVKGLEKLREKIESINIEREDYDYYIMEGKEEALAQIDILIAMYEEKE